MIAASESHTGPEPDRPRPQIWSAFLLLLLPFVPVITAYSAYRLGLSHGCTPTAATACVVAGLNVADIILFAMAAAWLTVLGVLAPAIIATSIIHRSLDEFGMRLVIGGLVPACVIVGTVVAPTILSSVMRPPGCSLIELGPACSLFGTDVEQAFALAGAAPWPILFAVGPAIIYVVVYAIVLGIGEVARRARYRLALRAHELAARSAAGIAAEGHADPNAPRAVPAPPPPPSRPRKPLVYIPPKRVRPAKV